MMGAVGEGRKKCVLAARMGHCAWHATCRGRGKEAAGGLVNIHGGPVFGPPFPGTTLGRGFAVEVGASGELRPKSKRAGVS